MTDFRSSFVRMFSSSRYLWAPRASPTKSSYCMVAVPFIWASLVLKESVSLLIWTLHTMKLSRVNLRPRGLYLATRFWANVGENLFQISIIKINNKNWTLTGVTGIPLPGELGGTHPGSEFLLCFCHILRTFFSSRWWRWRVFQTRAHQWFLSCLNQTSFPTH